MDGLYADDEIDPIFRAVASHWITKIKSARDHKRKVFGDYAQQMYSFYAGPVNWDEVMSGLTAGMVREDEFPDPTFKMHVNKAFEFVTIFGPALYYENPVRTVKPRMPVVVPPQFYPNPAEYQALWQQENLRVMTDGLRSVLLESYLNWSPNEFGLDIDSRLAIDEALIKGRGCVWTELHPVPAATFKVVRSNYDSVDHLFVDPDAQCLADAKWIARKCVHPVWQVERDFGLRPGSIRGNLESIARQSDIETDEDLEYDRKRCLTNDLIVYYKIYSKMGIGGRLKGMLRDYAKPLEMFGDYCYVVVAENVAFPLNLPPDLVRDPSFEADPQVIFARTAWPTPFWGDGGWPVACLDFHAVHGCPWPMAHLRAGLGELKFLNWAMSFLSGHLRNSCRDFVAIKKSAGEEIKTSILEGKDLTLLEIEEDSPGMISEIVQFLQHPAINGDVWRLIEAVEENFDKRVGLTELMYGGTGATQPRSAEEVSLRNQNMNVRPADMGKQVESWQARIAANEALAARYHLLPDDVRPVLGDMGATAWTQYVASRDVPTICHQLDYRIESGSTRRPNKNAQIAHMSQGFQALAPLLQAYGQATGDMQPLNNLLGDYAQSLDLDPARYQLRAAPPQPTPGNPGAPPGPEQAEGSPPG